MTEREQFEEWVKANWPDSIPLGQNVGGGYRYTSATAMYQLWRESRLKSSELRGAWWFGWCAGVASVYFAVVIVGAAWGL